ncbi:polysaccharide deacetylase family protein [Paenibacillus sp. YPG26]|uniref:polysaccharide deacetylase family protein n=1 Tax=Paenibacillus sp. YPG26 TaxID=2878915 RepID=UPI002040937E|nr:polysaccharide deacetylase family protein [Paenibacillus sp. YPG26]USB31601.1 polysaccharide deacetylase [Paenibacillus sp. YPG26]
MNLVMERSNKTRTERAHQVRRKRNRLIITINLLLISVIAFTMVLTYNIKQEQSSSALPKLSALNSERPDAKILKEKHQHAPSPVRQQPVRQSQKSPDKNTRVTPGAATVTTEQSKIKVVYLTFDDGPNQYTDQLLNILGKNNIHATFFMIGSQLRDGNDSVKRLIREGHYPGLHSMSHNYNKLYKSGDAKHFIQEFKQEQALLYKLTGANTNLIRAPYGSAPQIGYHFRTDIYKAGFKLWDWTTDSKDWSYEGHPEKIIQQVKRQAHRRQEIILLHENKQTVQALPQIIACLKRRGYSFAVYKPEHHIIVNFGKDSRL